jgi:hypothetical protein
VAGDRRYRPASLSQMQVINFSVIVLFLVIYILLRTGILASLSSTVLLARHCRGRLGRRPIGEQQHAAHLIRELGLA